MQGRVDILVSMACLLQFGATEHDPELLQRALSHSAFLSYQQGKLHRSAAIASIAARYKVDNSVLEMMLTKLVENCEVDEQLLTALKSTGKTLLGWIDIPAEEWKQVHAAFPSSLWDNFAGFTSSLESITDRRNLVVIDRNVEMASVHASHGLIALPYAGHRNKEACIRYLHRFLLPAAISKGEKALQSILNDSRNFNSVLRILSTGRQESVFDYFALFLAAICLPKVLPDKVKAKVKSLVSAGEPFGFLWTDFSRLPPDIDVMSFCTSVLLDMNCISSREASQILDICLSNVNSEGELLTYLDPQRPRQDPVVVANVIYLAYALGKEDHPVVQYNETLIEQFLLLGGYAFGTIYYPQPESFLFHYGRIIIRFKERTRNYDHMFKAIQSALINRIGNAESKPLDIAKRLLLCRQFGIENHSDLDLLLEMQKEDGTWPLQVIYALNTSKGVVYNPVVDLSYVLKALQDAAEQ